MSTDGWTMNGDPLVWHGDRIARPGESVCAHHVSLDVGFTCSGCADLLPERDAPAGNARRRVGPEPADPAMALPWRMHHAYRAHLLAAGVAPGTPSWGCLTDAEQAAWGAAAREAADVEPSGGYQFVLHQPGRGFVGSGPTSALHAVAADRDDWQAETGTRGTIKRRAVGTWHDTPKVTQ